MEFFRVQIPYRGIIPLLNRKGPVPCVELTRDQVLQLKEYKVEMLDPDTGKPFLFPENRPIMVTLDDFANARPISKQEAARIISGTPAKEEKIEDSTPDEGAQSNDKTPDQENTDAEVSEPDAEEIALVYTTEAASEETGDSDIETEGTSEAATTNAVPEFDFNRIKGYSNLPRKKKKELRAYYQEAAVGASAEDLDKIYEVLNSMTSKQN